MATVTVLHPAMTTETIQITGHNGDEIDAYVAKPAGPGPFAAVLVAHHMPGWDEWCIEVTRRFAHHGYLAVCPNLHHRMGPGTPAEMSARIRDDGGQRDAFVLGDLQGALGLHPRARRRDGQSGRHRLLLRRARRLHDGLQPGGGCGGRLLGRQRHPHARPHQREPADAGHRHDAQPGLSGPGVVRERRRQPGHRAGERHRGGAPEARGRSTSSTATTARDTRSSTGAARRTVRNRPRTAGRRCSTSTRGT